MIFCSYNGAFGSLLCLLLLSLHAQAKNVSYSSALKIAASHTRAFQHFTGVPALPLPKNASSIPKYRVVDRIAAGWPIIQQVSPDALPTAEEMEASMIVGADEYSAETPELIGRSTGVINLMIVGDSISQGQQGDYTWRYRLWQWLNSQTGVSFQFVGPYTGTFQSQTALATGVQPPTPPPPLYTPTPSSSGGSGPLSISVNGAYAQSVDPNFLKTGGWNHFANWGRAMATDQGIISQYLSPEPNIILLELGFNDMGWFYSDCYGLIESLDNFINNVRAVSPNTGFAVANVPQRTYIREDLVTNITTYNQILPPYIAQKTTAQSPIMLVEFQQNYACGTVECPAGKYSRVCAKFLD